MNLEVKVDDDVKFITELELKVLSDDSFRLTEDFYVFIKGVGEVVIPEGFETDLASVPRLPLVYLLVGGRGHKAAVIHDWLYVTNLLPRDQCDLIFYKALRVSGVMYVLAKAMYAGVRVGGGSYYDLATELIAEQRKQKVK